MNQPKLWRDLDLEKANLDTDRYTEGIWQRRYPSPLAEELIADRERLDWLELMANTKVGILLHDGSTLTGHFGLGLRPGTLCRTLRRTLREAIDAARNKP